MFSHTKKHTVQIVEFNEVWKQRDTNTDTVAQQETEKLCAATTTTSTEFGLGEDRRDNDDDVDEEVKKTNKVKRKGTHSKGH